MNLPASLASVLEPFELPLPTPVDGFADPVWRVDVPGERALEIWRAIRSGFEESGLWPILVGDYGQMVMDGEGDWLIEQLIENFESLSDMTDEQLEFCQIARDVDGLLQLAEACDFEQWAGQRRDPEFLVREYLRKAEHFDTGSKVPRIWPIISEDDAGATHLTSRRFALYWLTGGFHTLTWEVCHGEAESGGSV